MSYPIQFILYVSDQARSSAFYQSILRRKPDLDVPGMTEFNLTDTCKLGLMPNKGIARIIGDQLPHPDTGNGIPRCELYFYVKDVQEMFAHGLQLGISIISPVSDRDWGDRVCYFADPDGHVIAFAEKLQV
ncbi:MAG: hypothetical protein JNN28_18670 [Saprospiraceae bacterium]|nr:hypothetical protein [Saprospiraceae bacterium]